jgi:cytochrome c-type biogenesis protein CcmH/NrfF
MDGMFSPRLKKIGAVLLALLVLVLALGFWLKTRVERRVERVLHEKTARLAPFATLHYARVAFDPLAWDLHIHDVQIALLGQPPVSIEEMVIERWDRNRHHRLPYTVAVRLRHAHVPAALLGRYACPLAACKARLPFSLALSLRYEEAQQTVRLQHMDFEIPAAGRMQLKAELEHVPWQDGLGAVMATSYAIVLRQVAITYCDHALLDRVVTEQARERGIGPQDLRQSWHDALEEKKRQALNDAAQKRFYTSLQAFLQHPRCLDLQLAPSPAPSLGGLVQAMAGDAWYAVLQPVIRVR